MVLLALLTPKINELECGTGSKKWLGARKGGRERGQQGRGAGFEGRARERREGTEDELPRPSRLVTCSGRSFPAVNSSHVNLFITAGHRRALREDGRRLARRPCALLPPPPITPPRGRLRITNDATRGYSRRRQRQADSNYFFSPFSQIPSLPCIPLYLPLRLIFSLLSSSLIPQHSPSS